MNRALEAIERIRAMDKPFLTPEDVAPAIERTAQTIRDTARDFPQGLPFPVIRTGSTTSIPRIPFLRALGYEVET